MLFFCPLDNINQPARTTLAEQQAAIAADGSRSRQGLCVDAPSPGAAADTMRAYLLDCIRSGRPGYAPTVELDDREGVPVATLAGDTPIPSPSEAAAITAMTARAKQAMERPAAKAPANDTDAPPVKVPGQPRTETEEQGTDLPPG
jgi:hypothetical protein